jgi:hypothetical protein
VPRPELPLGTWGQIRREQVGPQRFRARARFRDYDGVTRDVEAWGNTGAAAERALRVKLRDRSTPNNDEITADMRIGRLGELWLDEIIAEDRIAPQTLGRYETSFRTAIRPALGNLRLREATVSRLDRFFKAIAAKHPAAARGAKTWSRRPQAAARIAGIRRASAFGPARRPRRCGTYWPKYRNPAITDSGTAGSDAAASSTLSFPV